MLNIIVTAAILANANPPAFDPVVHSSPEAPHYSSLTALGLAIGTTVGSLATGIGMITVGSASDNASARGWLIMLGTGTLALGLILGPSVGHFYVGEVGSGLLRSGLRLLLLGGGVAMTIGGLVASAGCMNLFGGPPRCSEGERTGHVALIVGGPALAVGSLAVTIYDFVDAPRAAERANQTVVAGLNIAPVVGPSEQGTFFGLALSGKF